MLSPTRGAELSRVPRIARALLGDRVMRNSFRSVHTACTRETNKSRQPHNLLISLVPAGTCDPLITNQVPGGHAELEGDETFCVDRAADPMQSTMSDFSLGPCRTFRRSTTAGSPFSLDVDWGREGRLFVCAGRFRAYGRMHFASGQGGQNLNLQLQVPSPMVLKPINACHLASVAQAQLPVGARFGEQ